MTIAAAAGSGGTGFPPVQDADLAADAFTSPAPDLWVAPTAAENGMTNAQKIPGDKPKAEKSVGERGHSTFLFPVGLGRGGGESGRGQRERRWAGGAIT